MSQLTPDMIVFIVIPLALQLLALMAIAPADSRLAPRQRRFMFAISLLVLVLVVLDFVHSQPARDPLMVTVRTAASVYGYAARPLIIVLFMELVGLERGRSVAWVLVALNAAVFLTAFFSPLTFSMNAEGHFVRGPLGYTSHIVCGILLVWLFVLSVRLYGETRKRYAAIPSVCVVVILVAAVIDSDLFWAKDWLPFLTLVMPTVCFVFYLWLHMKLEREYERFLLAEQRIQIMVSQIQPHFLFNTLATIQAFCRTDPARAAEITERFGAYLRQNIDSLSQASLVAFSKELEHTRTYADIEMTRFPHVDVTFDIRDDAFQVPALSVQPLVENAIRHGVRIREQGRVEVASRREGAFHIVEVRDNGVGFDVSALEDGREGEHIGLSNVRERVELMCGGTLQVESTPDEGTTVTLRIPGEQEKRT